MDMYELFDPRYQLGAEDPEESSPRPADLPEELLLALWTIDDIIARTLAEQSARNSGG